MGGGLAAEGNHGIFGIPLISKRCEFGDPRIQNFVNFVKCTRKSSEKTGRILTGQWGVEGIRRSGCWRGRGRKARMRERWGRGVPKNFHSGLAEGENVLDATPVNACGNHGVNLREDDRAVGEGDQG